MNAFIQLLLANLRMLYRDRYSFIWNLAVPIILYSVVAAFAPRLHIAQFDYGNFLLPGVITYVLMQGGIYSLAYWLVDLRSREVIKRFLVTPIQTFPLVASVLVSRLLILLLQVAILSLIGSLIFHAPFAGNIGSILLLTILGGSIFLLIGLLISAAAGSYQAAAPFTAAIGLPFMVLGNIFIPLRIFPKSMQVIGNLLPITYLADGLRQAYLHTFDAQKIGKDIFILVVWLFVLIILTLFAFRLRED